MQTSGQGQVIDLTDGGENVVATAGGDRSVVTVFASTEGR